MDEKKTNGVQMLEGEDSVAMKAEAIVGSKPGDARPIDDGVLADVAGGSPANAICFKCWLPKWACRCKKR